MLSPLVSTGPASPALAAVPSPAPDARTPSPSPSSAPDPCADGSEEAPVRIEVTTLAPRAPTSPDEPFQVAGRLVNCGIEPLTRLQLRLVVGSKIASRSGLARAADEPVLGTRRVATAPADEEDLPPRGATTFDLRLPVRDLALGRENGVFPLAVQARAVYGDASTREAVGLASTFVPWFPDGPISPTRIAWLLPVVDEPRRAPNGVLLDEDLEAAVTGGADGGGRLHQLLEAARVGATGGCDLPAAPPGAAPVPDQAAVPTPVCRGEAVPLTYGVDADLLGTIEAMTRPYTVLVRGKPVERPASAAATAWLAQAKQSAAAGAVLALPYGDPDVVALSRPESGAGGDVELLRQLGQSETRQVLGVDDLLTSTAWPPAGPIGGALDALVSGGRSADPPAIVLGPDDLAGVPSSGGRTPGARSTLSSATGPVTALTVDTALSLLAGAGPGDAGWPGARLAEQRWIAEAAVLAAERPSESRTFVVAPRRRSTLVPAVAGAVIADTGRLPWLCPVTLAATAAGTERCAGLPDDQGPAPGDSRTPPARADRPPAALPVSYVEQLAEVRQRSDQFTDDVLLPGSEQAKATKARLLRARGRAASSAWRDDLPPGQRLLGLLRDDVDALRDRVRLVSGPVTLTGSAGTMRLTVENSLEQPVSIGVRLDETSEARLSSQDTGVREVPPSQAVQIPVRVEARTSGRFVARAQLIDASGDVFGPPVDLAVRSTQYGRVALGITGVAAAVLLITAGVRITRRAMSSRSGGGGS